jgi:hypothetical protein
MRLHSPRLKPAPRPSGHHLRSRVRAAGSVVVVWKQPIKNDLVPSALGASSEEIGDYVRIKWHDPAELEKSGRRSDGRSGC